MQKATKQGEPRKDYGNNLMKQSKPPSDGLG